MDWHRPGDKQLSEPMMISLPTHIYVTRPQWVKDTSMKSEYWNLHDSRVPYCFCTKVLKLMYHQSYCHGWQIPLTLTLNTGPGKEWCHQPTSMYMTQCGSVISLMSYCVTRSHKWKQKIYMLFYVASIKLFAWMYVINLMWKMFVVIHWCLGNNKHWWCILVNSLAPGRF